jgi:hypothetical protein
VTRRSAGATRRRRAVLSLQMKKALAIGALAAVLVATTALAATTTYRGAIKGDEKSSVALQVKRGDGARQLRSFVAKDFLISCRTTDARLESATISGRVRVDGRGRFQVTGSNGGRELKVTGKLTGRKHAEGTVRYSGPTIVDGQRQSCDSGKLDWRASR